jgi:hypothetical protein
MQTTGEKTGHDEVTQRPQSHKLDDDRIEDNLNHEINQMPHRGRLVPYEPRSEGVKQYLERATQFQIRVMHYWRSPDLRKENLPEDIVEQDQFQLRGEIGIDPILPKVFVMLKMIPLHQRQNRSHNRRPRLTLKAEQYGIPMGKFANIASTLLNFIPLNARLCVISWIARNKFWFAVAPIT